MNVNRYFMNDPSDHLFKDEDGNLVMVEDYKKLHDALWKIYYYDEEDIWWDSRDDAANDMLRIAGVAIGLEGNI